MEYLFKTNINCSGCVAKVKPFLENASGIQHWEVNTLDPKKILKVEAEAVSSEEIRDIIQQAGYTATLVEPSEAITTPSGKE